MIFNSPNNTPLSRQTLEVNAKLRNYYYRRTMQQWSEIRISNFQYALMYIFGSPWTFVGVLAIICIAAVILFY